MNIKDYYLNNDFYKEIVMNAEQKRAWFTLGVVGVACLGFVVVGLAIRFSVAWGALGVLGLSGFTPLIGRGERGDERDHNIGQRASLIGGMASYLVFVLGCMGVWFIEFAWRGQSQVSVHVLSAITMGGYITFKVVRSLAILVLYGRQIEADNG